VLRKPVFRVASGMADISHCRSLWGVPPLELSFLPGDTSPDDERKPTEAHRPLSPTAIEPIRRAEDRRREEHLVALVKLGLGRDHTGGWVVGRADEAAV